MAVGQTVELKLDTVVFRKDLYPRIETSTATVQKYAEDLTVLPPIEVNQHNELLDGWHRWTAHKKAGAPTIRATVTPTKNEGEFLEVAIRRNAAHGLQLSQEDKRKVARDIYNATDDRERDAKKKLLATILSVSERTIREWLGRIDKDSKEARDRRIFEMWLACYTDAEIGDAVGLTSQGVGQVLKESANLPFLSNPDQAAANHATDFDPPLYNIWKQQEKTNGSSHFGNSEVRWLDNLLYLYTNPFDVVVDPFAGGGSTIDLCRKRFRRYFVSDRKPIVEATGDAVPRHKQIREHDLTDGLPTVARWKDVRLVYLDPPYWKQAEGQYSTDKNDLANMMLDRFNETLAGIINGFAKKLTDAATIALIIQPTQWKAPERAYTDHVADMIRAVKLPIDMRFSVPYESQQCNAQMVEWAKKERRPLVLTREIVVWRV